MTKKEAIEVMERIKKYFMNAYYPIKYTMYDREHTVGQMFDKALEVLSE